MTITRFAFPTTIHFGPGARKLVGPHLREAGLKRPLVVTDKGLAALPLVAELKKDLAAAGLEPSVFGGVWGNPTGSQVMAGAGLGPAPPASRRSGHRASGCCSGRR
jgi:alcohol dehydrogenase class IV